MVRLLLAAGAGRRFGGNKGLAPLPDGTPMALRSALNLRHKGQPVICVVRPGDVVLSDTLAENGFKVVVAEAAASGMSASLQAGVNASPDAVGWMVALADMPLIKPQTYQQLAAAFMLKAQITVPCLSVSDQSQQTLSTGKHSIPKPQQGHPVIFPAHCKTALLALRGDKGAKLILQQHAADVQRVWVDDPGILQDFDTRQALERL